MRLVRASEIEEKNLSWLWPGLIPLGQCCILEGDPGTAKSTLTLAIAAHVSTGSRWPDEATCPQGHVIIANAEDPEEEVIVPRLKVAGANLRHCHIMVPDIDSSVGDSFTIPDHVEKLERLITTWGVKLVVFDPIEAFLSASVDNYRNHHVRKALRTLEQLAKHLNCSVIFVRHLNKATDKAAIYRGGGSIGIIGAARAAISVGRDKADPSRCIMVPVKQNWTKIRGGMAFRPEERHYSTSEGVQITTSTIKWDGPVQASADDVITADTEPGASGSTEEAAMFIREALEKGPRSSNELFAWAKKAGIARKTIWRASRLMDIRKTRQDDGVNACWVWSLPSDEDAATLTTWAGSFDINDLTPNI
ncbi:MAG: AAA family ATPase [Patescibacteria group bacterium]|nr:AAA family ATPase [Patescibacteria group bacterium]